MLLSEKYRMARFNAGKEVGKEEGKELGKEVERNRIREILRQSGVELTPEVEESLFGAPDKHSDNGQSQ